MTDPNFIALPHSDVNLTTEVLLRQVLAFFPPAGITSSTPWCKTMNYECDYGPRVCRSELAQPLLIVSTTELPGP